MKRQGTLKQEGAANSLKGSFTDSCRTNIPTQWRGKPATSEHTSTQRSTQVKLLKMPRSTYDGPVPNLKAREYSKTFALNKQQDY